MKDPDDGFVLDCSMTMAWCSLDEATPESDAVRDRLETIGAVVPAIWPLEVANVAIIGERRGRLDRDRSDRFFALIRRLPIVVDAGTSANAFGATMLLARDHSLSAYDASYLELAIRRGLPLASLDRKPIDAARA